MNQDREWISTSGKTYYREYFDPLKGNYMFEVECEWQGNCVLYIWKPDQKLYRIYDFYKDDSWFDYTVIPKTLSTKELLLYKLGKDLYPYDSLAQ